MPALTVKALKEMLNGGDIEDHYIIVLSKDGEGNSFSPVSDSEAGFYTVGLYVPDTTWSGDFTGIDDMDDEFSPNAVVLWPTN